MGRGPEAIEWFNEGSRIAEEAHLPVRQSFNLLATGALYVEQGQIDEALAAYEEAILLSRRANRADNLANGLTLLGDVLITLGRPADATPRYEEAVTILEGIGQRPRLSEAMGKLARAREAAGLPDAAGTWREVWELRAELGDRAGMLEAAERQAALFRGPTERARELNRSLLHQAEELGDRASAARTRNRLATLAWREEEFEEARREYEAALELLEDQEDPEGLGVVLNGLGATLTRLGRREEAIEVLERALKVNRLADVPTREADSMAALGAAHRAAGNLTRAYDWYQQCAEKRADAGDRPGEGWALLRLSELSREAGAEERARALAGEALSIAREVGDGELEEQAKDRTTG
jgi:tetratricopeptide (TPR) repeat protein